MVSLANHDPDVDLVGGSLSIGFNFAILVVMIFEELMKKVRK
jgi:hypothetical protein